MVRKSMMILKTRPLFITGVEPRALGWVNAFPLLPYHMPIFVHTSLHPPADILAFGILRLYPLVLEVTLMLG